MKRKKRKKAERKERILEVRVAFEGNVTIAGVTAPGIEPMQFFGPDGQPVLPKHIEVGQGYARRKRGLKVLHRSPADPVGLYREPNRALMRFATILAVDTNTRLIEGTRVSVAASLWLRDLRFDEREPLRWHATIHPQPGYEFHDALVSPELVGWINILERALATGVPTPAALLVDSELDRLSRYNRREEPILDGFELPAGFTLVYASGERGTTEFAGSAAIAQCDRLATSVLDRIKQHPEIHQWSPTANPPNRWVKRHREWTGS